MLWVKILFFPLIYAIGVNILPCLLVAHCVHDYELELKKRNYKSN